MVAWFKKLYRDLIQDEVSWFVHWIICMGGSIATAVVLGPYGGLAASEIFLGYFCFREGYNWGHHELLETGANKARYLKDGILDLAGPIINAVLWWGVIFYA